MNMTHRRSTTARWAALVAKILAGVAGVALIVLVGLFAYAANDVGDFYSPPVRTSGKVGDLAVREEYGSISHLVTASQITAIHPQMPGKTAFQILGGPSQKIPVTTRIKQHWVRTGTCYDYPIAGTGHLYDGFTVADQVEICLSHPHNGLSHRHYVVTSITRIPWRKVGKRDHSWS